MLQYTENLMYVYRDKPHFMLSFLAQLSHDNVNLVGTMDGDLHDWLVDVHERGFLNNTLLIVFSDHGPRYSFASFISLTLWKVMSHLYYFCTFRFADIRQTIQGKQEERLPFFSFAFPPWFKHKHPEAYNNFVVNTKRLTSPFDIHATLQHVIHFPSKLGENSLKNRSMSLFKQVCYFMMRQIKGKLPNLSITIFLPSSFSFLTQLHGCLLLFPLSIMPTFPFLGSLSKSMCPCTYRGSLVCMS